VQDPIACSVGGGSERWFPTPEASTRAPAFTFGELMGIGPTGKQVTVSGLTLSRLANGKVIEEYTNWGDVRDDAAT
jgi:hypothetical protein